MTETLNSLTQLASNAEQQGEMTCCSSMTIVPS